jgi:hypothetical protein
VFYGLQEPEHELCRFREGIFEVGGLIITGLVKLPAFRLWQSAAQARDRFLSFGCHTKGH